MVYYSPLTELTPFCLSSKARTCSKDLDKMESQVVYFRNKKGMVFDMQRMISGNVDKGVVKTIKNRISQKRVEYNRLMVSYYSKISSVA